MKFILFRERVSSCCGVSLILHSDICSKCLEHSDIKYVDGK